MNREFWLERWKQGQVGFHLPRVNPHLIHHWPALGLAPGSRVLVPLCGKSLDLWWLHEQGHEVLGVEWSEKAVADFFAERHLLPQIEQRGAFRCYRQAGIEICCGDFFALDAAQVADCAALYDRAALIALPPALRERYAQHLSRIMPQGCRGLLVNLEYEQAKMDGPPFSVPVAEVTALFASHWRVEPVHRKSVLESNPRFRQQGLASVDEVTLLLTRKDPVASG